MKIRYRVVPILAIVLIFQLFDPYTVKAQVTSEMPLASGERFNSAQSSVNSDESDQIIIKYKGEFSSDSRFAASSADQIDKLSKVAGVPLTFYRQMAGNAYVLRLPSRIPINAIQAITQRLTTLPELEYAEPDKILHADYVPNDPMASQQWNYASPSTGTFGINMTSVWDIPGGSSDVVVAVIDTGITNHIEFSGRILPGYDFINDILIANDGDGRDNNASDPGDWITPFEDAYGYFAGCGASNSSWHGTHVAGIIGASTDNGIGISGINGHSKILPVRVLGKCGGYTSDIVDGISWAAGLNVPGVPVNQNPAKVINLSLGGPATNNTCSTNLQSAINSALAQGTTIVVSAGNENSDAISSEPANCTGVITVGATNRYGKRASYSNYGSKVSISAPGGDAQGKILSTLNSGTNGPVSDTYANYAGTSMAAPHVSGVVSLIYSHNPTLSPVLIKAILQQNVTIFPSVSDCTTAICGQGILNAYSSILAAIPPGPFARSSPANGTTIQTLEPDLSWTSSANVAAYEYCFSQVNSCSSWINNGNSTIVDLGTLTPGMTYFWNVRAVNPAGTKYADNSIQNWSFTILSKPGAFTKISPNKDAQNLPLNPTLSWTSSANVDYYEYCYSTTTPCTTWTNNGTSTSVTLNGLMGDTSYHWNVRAVNPNGITLSDASTGDWLFKTIATVSGPFYRLSPANNAQNQALNPTLRWTPSANVGYYEYCFSTSTPCSNWTNNGTITRVTLNGLNWDTPYYWNVRAVNSYGTTLADASPVDWLFRTATKPVPVLTSLSPAYAQVNSGELTIAINGTGFINGDTVYWNGNPLSTSYIAPSRLTSTISAADLVSIAIAQVTVTDPDLVTSNALPFSIHTFADVPPTHIFWRYIEGFYAEGITTGCSGSPMNYCPDNLVTRSAMAVFLLRAKNGTEYQPPAATGIFTDLPVTGKEWMKPWVEEFYREGITTGCSADPLQYCPENSVTRAAMAVFLLRAKYGADYQPPAATGIFADLPVTGKEWMEPWVEQFYREGITTGCGVDPLRYCPEDPVKRQAMAVFIDRAFGIPQIP